MYSSHSYTDNSQYRDINKQLFDAVFLGDIARVKELVAAGIDTNSVIHTPVKWEGATVLSIAAHEGHLEIVKFLVKSGTSVNFIDPCMRRNALHWACMGNQYDVAKYLIQNGVDVNHVDKENNTALAQATICQNVDLVQYLIQNGSDTTITDVLQCSPLHYACMQRNSSLVKTIIKGGCVLCNSSALGKGTPLKHLAVNNDVNNCRLLLEAGYNLNDDSWFQQTKNDNITKMITDYIMDAKTLQNLSRTTIRKNLKGVKIEECIGRLELPDSLKLFLKMDDF